MVTAIIPTLNEEKRIGEIIRFLKTKPLISEIIVIDDGSVDSTFTIAEGLGAIVHLSSMLGKGTSMVDGLKLAQNEIVLYLDGDIYGFSENIIEIMTEPLIRDQADFVKGKFHRKAGRVTALTAKPLLKMFFPELASFEQPLGGIIAGKKSFLKQVAFEQDYGVDIGILIDVHQLGARITEADIGYIEHDQQSLEALSTMSFQIVRTILQKAAHYNKLNLSMIQNSYELDRKSNFAIETILDKISSEKKIALIDMDGTLVEGSFITSLAEYCNLNHKLTGLIGNHTLEPAERTKLIAKVLEGIPKAAFEKIAQNLTLKPHAQEFIIELKKEGYQVGIITDSYYLAAEIVRKRVFADFSVAHFLDFENELATGEITISPLMMSPHGCSNHTVCKSNFILHLKSYLSSSLPLTLSIGNGENDTCLFKATHESFAIYPQSNKVVKAARYQISTLTDVLDYITMPKQTGS